MQGVVKGLLYAVCILLIALACAAFVGVLISVVCFLAAPWGEMQDILGVDFPILQFYDSNPSWLLWICGVSVLILIGMTLFIAMHFLMRMMGKASELSTPLRVACVVIWLVALIVFAASWTRMISNVSMRYAEPYRSETELRKDREIRQLGYLEKAGWTLVKGNGVDGRYTGWGKHFSDNGDVRYLHGEANEGSMAMEYEVCRNLKVAPGIYDVKAAVRTNGKGAEIYAVNGMGKRYSLPIPVCGAQGGNDMERRTPGSGHGHREKQTRPGDVEKNRGCQQRERIRMVGGDTERYCRRQGQCPRLWHHQRVRSRDLGRVLAVGMRF